MNIMVNILKYILMATVLTDILMVAILTHLKNGALMYILILKVLMNVNMFSAVIHNVHNVYVHWWMLIYTVQRYILDYLYTKCSYVLICIMMFIV